MMRAHSILPPSSAARRMACPGSRALEEKFKKEDHGKAAREGDRAHEIAHQFAMTGIMPDNVDPEMDAGARLYASVVAGHDIVHYEERVDISAIHPDCFGTPDAWTLVSRKLYVYDYKYGHKPVSAFENWQLLEYAAGITSSHDLDVDNFELVIVQPRAYGYPPVNRWEINAYTMNQFAHQLREGEKRAMLPDAPLIPSPEGCQYCTARHACPALSATTRALVDQSTVTQPLVELTPVQVGLELRMLNEASRFLNARMTALNEMAAAEINAGKNVPFFRLQSQSSKLVWNKPVEEIRALAELMDIPIDKPAEILTPTQALSKGMPKEILTSYTETQRGALKLTEVKEKEVKQIFTNHLGVSYE